LQEWDPRTLGLRPSDDNRTLPVFTADELLQSGLAPEELLKAQGFDPAPLAQLKFDRDQTGVLPPEMDAQSCEMRCFKRPFEVMARGGAFAARHAATRQLPRNSGRLGIPT
jgi:hypothetical protein